MSRRTGLTLLEVVVSVAIVGMLALVLMAANVPMTRASSEAGVAFDLDRAAGRFLSELRREVRQSGYNEGDLQLSLAVGIDGGDPALGPFSTLGPFRRRTSFGVVVDDTSASNWSREITYALAASRHGAYADGAPRYVVRRAQAGVVAEVLDHVQGLAFAQVAGSDTVSVTLTLRRENPTWTGDATGRFISHAYREEIELLNKLPEVP